VYFGGFWWILVDFFDHFGVFWWILVDVNLVCFGGFWWILVDIGGIIFFNFKTIVKFYFFYTNIIECWFTYIFAI
jgi:hypothetical protein